MKERASSIKRLSVVECQLCNDWNVVARSRLSPLRSAITLPSLRCAFHSFPAAPGETVHLSLHSVMLSAPVIVSLIVLSLATNSALGESDARPHLRQRRQGSVACFFEFASAAKECHDELVRQTKGVDTKGHEDFATCCFVSAFRACLSSEAERLCGKDSAETFDSVAKTFQEFAMQKCIEYDTPGYAFLCIGYTNSAWLVTIGVILFIFTCGCIIGSRCR